LGAQDGPNVSNLTQFSNVQAATSNYHKGGGYRVIIVLDVAGSVVFKSSRLLTAIMGRREIGVGERC